MTDISAIGPKALTLYHLRKTAKRSINHVLKYIYMGDSRQYYYYYCLVLHQDRHPKSLVRLRICPPKPHYICSCKLRDVV